jgi:glycosyltransferase involved in cell wall biosynthesis
MAESKSEHFPLISLVLATRNAMPHLKTAIGALQRQTYRTFELLVQDGGSTDGTLEYLSSITDLPLMEVISEPDAGIGQAYNRGLRRCRGDLVCLVSSDEYLNDDALERGARCFHKYPQAAIIYGGERLVDANDEVIQVFLPPAFELLGVIRNEIVPPIAAAFLNREKVGEDL